MIDEVLARGELGETVIVVLSDNGFSFGEHRWVGKRCPYSACVRTPLVVRSPWASAATVGTPVSNVDLAPTIVDLAGLATATPAFDGRSLRPMLDPGSSDALERDAVLVGWAGDGDVPPWHGVRTADFSYVEHADGSIELYDIGGALGPADPLELRNIADDPASAAVRSTLAATLRSMLAEEPRPAGT